MLRFWSLLWVLLLLAPGARAEWHLAETAHFRLFVEGKAEVARTQAAMLEDYRRLLIAATGREPPADIPKLDVYMVKRIADASPGRSLGPSVAGFWRATPGGMAAFASLGGGTDLGGQVILFHEVAHHFMLADALLAYPAWYIEGFAEYFSTADFRPDRIEIGRFSENRAVWLTQGAWMSPERLLRGPPEAGGGAAVAMFYAQSWLLTHWLFRAPEASGRITHYLRRTAAGEDPVEAFQAEVLPRLSDLNPKLRTYFEGRKITFTRIRREPLAAADVTVRALPPSADRLLMPMVAIEHGVDRERGAALLALVREQAARAAADDDLARRALSLAELTHGDPAVAARLIDAELQASPRDATLLRWRGEAWLRQGDTGQARRSFADSFRLDPNDWRTLMAWVRTQDPSRLSDNELDVLRRAWTLAPQIGENVLAMALALGFRGDLADAALVLRPLAFSPHGGRAAARAQAMMAAARAGDQKAFLALFSKALPVGEAEGDEGAPSVSALPSRLPTLE